MNENINSNTNFDVMLSTSDNPYNPFTQFDDWYNYDTSNGYDTCNYLARVVLTSDDLSEADEALAIKQAIDDIIRLNILGIYIKVTPDTFDNRPKPPDTV
jgi:hypothetical protein